MEINGIHANLRDVCDFAVKSGWITGSSGNVSHRYANTILISESGSTLSEHSIGSALRMVQIFDPRASSDKNLHAEMYRLCRISWILHVHKNLDLGDFNWKVPGHEGEFGTWMGFKKLTIQ